MITSASKTKSALHFYSRRLSLALPGLLAEAGGANDDVAGATPGEQDDADRDDDDTWDHDGQGNDRPCWQAGARGGRNNEEQSEPGHVALLR